MVHDLHAQFPKWMVQKVAWIAPMFFSNLALRVIWKSCLQKSCLWRAGAGLWQLRTPKMPTPLAWHHSAGPQGLWPWGAILQSLPSVLPVAQAPPHFSV